MTTTRIGVLLGCALLLCPATATAQLGDFLKKKVEEKAKQKAGQAIDETGNKAYDEGKKAPTAGKKDEAPSAAQAKPSPSDEAAQAEKGGVKKGEAPAEEQAAGDAYGNKFDFVPGNEVLLYDDFAETSVGDYPARWTVKDGGGGNTAEVVSNKGKKWFKAVPSDSGVNPASTHFLRYEIKGDLPKKFTVELDADMGAPFWVVFRPKSGPARDVTFNREDVRSANVTSPLKPAGKVVKRISISVNGTYVKAYVGGTRVLQDPDGVERPIVRVGFRFDLLHGRKEFREDPEALDHQKMTSFRLAEGGKDVTEALTTDGRIVVHGIYFDTGSDVIRPESGGALRNVLQVIEGDPALKFRIEGHTDDQGGPKVNGPLSEKRAAAVKAWFVKQGVDGGRLTAVGIGATKPLQANSTAEGRANNRRVEFVKL